MPDALFVISCDPHKIPGTASVIKSTLWMRKLSLRALDQLAKKRQRGVINAGLPASCASGLNPGGKNRFQFLSRLPPLPSL